MNTMTLICNSDIALASTRTGAFSPTASFMPGGSAVSNVSFAGVFCSFAVPSALKAKKISKATLNLTIVPSVIFIDGKSYDAIANFGSTNGRMEYQGGSCTVRAFTNSTSAELLDYSSYSSMGSVVGSAAGSFGPVTASGSDGISHGGATGAARWTSSTASIDVTELFKNNVYDDVFTAVVSTPRVQCSIYGDASTLSGVISIPVAIRSKDGGNAPSIVIEYEDVIPTNENLYPNNSYIDQNSDVEFVWSFNSSSGTALAHSKVEWSPDQSVWNTIYDRDGTETSYKAVGVRFPAGKVYWKITTTDSLGVSASPSVASWTVMAAPEAPVILGATEEAQPTITWNASSQMAYSIKIFQNGTLKESEEVAKQTKSYKCHEFYEADATIEIRLKVMNQYEMWSEEVTRVITFDMEQPLDAQIFANVIGSNVRITANVQDDDATMYLFRYDPATQTSVNLGVIQPDEVVYDRYAPSGKRIGYFIRTVTQGYTDSIVDYVVVNIPGINLYCDGNALDLELSTETFMPLDDKHGRDSALAYYSGREYPCREVGQKRSHEITRTFYIAENDFPVLARMAVSDEPIIYRDNKGNVMLATLVSDLSAAAYLKDGYTIQATFEQIEEA